MKNTYHDDYPDEYKDPDENPVVFDFSVSMPFYNDDNSEDNDAPSFGFHIPVDGDKAITCPFLHDGVTENPEDLPLELQAFLAALVELFDIWEES